MSHFFTFWYLSWFSVISLIDGFKVAALVVAAGFCMTVVVELLYSIVTNKETDGPYGRFVVLVEKLDSKWNN